MSKGRRLFFALWPPAALAAALHGQAAELQARWGGRVMRADTLHLTLAFLGQRPEASLQGLEAVAAAVACRHQTFALATGALGTFSRSGTTRLLWLGLAPSPALASLAEDLRGRLLASGEALDTKPFHPHVTLARFRQAQVMAMFKAPQAQGFNVDRLTLFESHPQGSYTELRSWSLRGL